jgi:Zn finger protein HypA/HybF involved in hydrogenase expression
MNKMSKLPNKKEMKIVYGKTITEMRKHFDEGTNILDITASFKCCHCNLFIFYTSYVGDNKEEDSLFICPKCKHVVTSPYLTIDHLKEE